MSKAPIVLAVDTSELATAIEWVKATHDYVSVFKLGLEFYVTFGSDGVKAIKNLTDADIFLDLKLTTISNYSLMDRASGFEPGDCRFNSY